MRLQCSVKWCAEFISCAYWTGGLARFAAFAIFFITCPTLLPIVESIGAAMVCLSPQFSAIVCSHSYL
jgi:hypothetical protein